MTANAGQRIILATHSDRNSVAESLSFQNDQEDTVSKPVSPNPPADALPVPSSSPPPALQLPVFHASLIDDEQNQYDIDCMNTSDEDTKNTFDFTGELQKLNESGASDRRSFVEQLENAFRTPAKVDLCYDFGGHLRPDAPPVPNIPLNFSTVTTSSSGDGSGSFGSQLLDVQQPTMLNTTRTEESESQSQFDFESGSKLVDIREPSSLLGSDELNNDIDKAVCEKKSSSSLLVSPALSSQRPSDGQLNRSFRFGGLPRSQSSTSLAKDDKQPLTLSDIIPPPSHVRSLSNSSSMDEDDSVLNSIFAKITGVQGRSRASSDASAHQIAREKRKSIYKAMSRPTSGISFTGFDSFDEVRRGFEFSDDRPTFYPPPSAATRRVPHRRHESALSIMSVSSYGHVINAGSLDPFDYGLPSLRESSEDMSSVSIMMDIDDTFAFMENRPRRRVESDASSFYFRAPLSQPHGQSFTRGHRHRDSNMSVSSQAPPISLYNRSFGTHVLQLLLSGAFASFINANNTNLGCNLL
jgi:serine/arginine repetitive matrix protein 2